MYQVSSQNNIQLLTQVFTSQKQNRVQQNKTKKKKGGGIQQKWINDVKEMFTTLFANIKLFFYFIY